jgi:hypothetical protein
MTVRIIAAAKTDFMAPWIVTIPRRATKSRPEKARVYWIGFLTSFFLTMLFACRISSLACQKFLFRLFLKQFPGRASLFLTNYGLPARGEGPHTRDKPPRAIQYLAWAIASVECGF